MGFRIQRPDVGTALQRFFRLTGQLGMEVEPFVLPVIPVGDLSAAGPPPIVRRATALINEAAVAGERFVGRFEMIPGAIAVIRQINLQASVANTNFSWVNRGNAAVLGGLATVSPKGYMDGRILPGSGQALTPAAVLTTGTQVGALAGPVGQIDLAADGLRYPIPGVGWIVGTGDPGLFGFLEFQIATNNILVEGSIEWDEYAIL